MAFDLGNDPAERMHPPRRFRSADGAGDIPASPPACVLDAVDAAFAHAERLHAAGRELHFGHDPMTGRLHVQVRSRAGRVLATLQPSAALDFFTTGAHD